MIRLYKFKRSEFKDKPVSEDDLTHYYMIAIAINTGCMFGGDSHLSNNILTFTPDFITEIYHKIFETIPCLEQGKQHYKLNEYNDANAQAVLEDDEPDIIDFEELINDYNFDADSIYYKGNGLNINIYQKESELKKRGLSYPTDIDYDFFGLKYK